jgi:hypothetical protein
LIVLLISAVPAGLEAEPAAGVLLVVVVVEELDELAHAVTSSTAAASPVTAHSFLIREVLLPPR